MEKDVGVFKGVGLWNLGFRFEGLGFRVGFRVKDRDFFEKLVPSWFLFSIHPNLVGRG